MLLYPVQPTVRWRSLSVLGHLTKYLNLINLEINNYYLQKIKQQLDDNSQVKCPAK